MITGLRTRVALVACAVVATLLTLEVLLRIAGFFYLAGQEDSNRRALLNKGALRILCIGESTTSRQYPPFLQESLSRRCPQRSFSVIDRGVPGISTTALVDRMEFLLDRYHPDMVVAMMGINDSGKHVFRRPHPLPGPWGVISRLRIYKLLVFSWRGIVLKTNGFLRRDGQEQEKKNTFLQQARHWRDLHVYEQAVQMYAAASRADPGDPQIYYEWGLCYQEPQERYQAAALFRQALALHPGHSGSLVGLGTFYHAEGDLPAAESCYRRAVQNAADGRQSYRAGCALAYILTCLGRKDEARAAHEAALACVPGDADAHVDLGWFLYNLGDRQAARLQFLEAVKLDPFNPSIHRELAAFYLEQKDSAAAEEVYLSAVERIPASNTLWSSLAFFYERQGNAGKAAACRARADQLLADYENPVTVSNYRRLKRLLDRRGVQLVCVQYPMRSIEGLQAVFPDDQRRGIIFVENRETFRTALRTCSYADLFADMFAGDFGHCLEAGNRLLAETIANAIISAVCPVSDPQDKR